MLKRHLVPCIVKCMGNISRKTENHKTTVQKALTQIWFPVKYIKNSDFFDCPKPKMKTVFFLHFFHSYIESFRLSTLAHSRDQQFMFTIIKCVLT